MNCIIRNAQMSDYDSVVRILNQGQALHINWRPDIYKPNDALLPKAVFEEIVKGDTFYIAENEGNVIGILELIFRHIEYAVKGDSQFDDSEIRGKMPAIFGDGVDNRFPEFRTEGSQLPGSQSLQVFGRTDIIQYFFWKSFVW